MDQEYLIVFAQPPDEASHQRNDDVRRHFGEIGKDIPAVELTFGSAAEPAAWAESVSRMALHDVIITRYKYVL